MTFSECQKNFLFQKGAKMKSNIGVIKEIDKLGRIVLPKSYRDSLGLKPNDIRSGLCRNDFSPRTEKGKTIEILRDVCYTELKSKP